jgi:hypothetical protein
MTDAAVDLIDGGSAAGTLKIYTGSQPTNPDTSASGTLLATFTLDATAFGDASNGVATLASTPLSTTGAADGTAGWFRVETGGTGGAGAVFDGTVTFTIGGGTIELNTSTISNGVTVEITSGTFTMPVGS